MLTSKRYSLLATAVVLGLSSASVLAGESVLWRNASTGQNIVHNYTGLTKSSESVVNVVADTHWKIVASGDFNGDGFGDLLWRNDTTGTNYVYFMNEQGISSAKTLNVISDLNWEVAGTGDFDHDGKSDILWRNKATGVNWVYLLDGVTLKSSALVNKVPDLNWKIAGVADFDGDGKSDILWRNELTGFNYIYFMDGKTILSQVKVNRVASTDWYVVAAKDFNGDGLADILWRNKASGMNFLYTMNGAAITTGNIINTVSTAWAIDAVLDMDGDNKADILWRNQQSGVLYGYLMNGSIIKSSGFVGNTLSSSWIMAGVVKNTSSVVTPTAVEISPQGPISLVSGECTTLAAKVRYSDNSLVDEASLAWSCGSNVTYDAVSDSLCGVSVGNTKCSATFANLSSSVSIDVTPQNKVVDHLALTPTGVVGLVVGQTQDMSLTVVYTDKTTAIDPANISWSCDSSIASINNDGLVTANAVGTTQCLAEYADKNITFSVEVSKAPLVPDHVEVVPSGTISLEAGSTQALIAKGFYTNGESVENPADVTWSCDPSFAAVASISDKGVLTAIAKGSLNCQASWQSKSVTIPVEVTPVAQQGIEVYFKKPDDWAGCNIHFWKASPLADQVWPGTAMEMNKPESPWCFYQFPANVVAANLLMNDGTGVKKTVDYLNVTKSGCPDGNGGWIAKDSCGLPVVGPKASATPGTSSFYTASTEVTLSVANGTAKYSYTDNACASGTAYSNGQKIVVGTELAINQSTTLYLCADDGATQSKVNYTYTKVDKPTTVFIDKLGFIYEKERTTFSVWSPDNTNVAVRVNGKFYRMTKTPTSLLNAEYSSKTSDVYSVTVPGDLHLASYNFVMNYKEGGEAGCRYTTSRYDSPTDCYYTRDPYGVMVEPGTDNNIVVDLAQTEPDGGWAPVPELKEREDAIIYEVHVRDFTIDATSGVTPEKRGTFLGMVESGTTYKTVKTGIDHLKELGVTHVQLLPMYDYATCSLKDSIFTEDRYGSVWSALGIPHQSTDTCYNWGYDPENYNVPEERYSMTPTDYVNRIKEVKTMINEFHKAGIRVVMDVVYNHVWIPDSRTFMHSMDRVFESYLGPITTRYSYSVNGKFYDLSGTGHTLNTDDPMVSQMVLDSLRFWASEYRMDGFRFDLAGIFRTSVVGHWAGTMMSEFADRTLLMYGEPWNGFATEPRGESNVIRLGTVGQIANTHFGVFNGRYRDAIRGEGSAATGGMFGDGFIFNSMNDANASITYGMRGAIRHQNSKDPNAAIDLWDPMFAMDPEQSINYVSAHDNYAIADKIAAWADASGQGSNTTYKNRLQMYANGIVLTSQGIPFIHAGAEIKRDKQRDHNSYLSPDSVNAIRWSLKTDNSTIFNYYKDLISVRRAHPGFRMNTWDEINTNVNTWVQRPGTVMSYIKGSANGDSWSEILVIYNSGDNFSYTPDGSGWKVAVEKSDPTAGGGRAVSGAVTVEGAAVTILYK